MVMRLGEPPDAFSACCGDWSMQMCMHFVVHERACTRLFQHERQLTGHLLQVPQSISADPRL